ncbi:CoA-binding protein [Fluviicola sp.]|jgi:predicted CoA-binding protein|uniref:CoA-binding protein n=1 Tax=Fluviicola sp. TaxID=1917219 RepID=UPI0028292B7B|nr:CoA-binding protein [Fluviicola sp.]MDR0801268.1 CoA-binding protein [Fluviicola sp.]
MGHTLVIGATTKEDRYANKAIRSLRNHQHQVIAFGPKRGTVEDIEIETEWNPNWEVDTVTLYLNPHNQEAYIDRIIALNPKRVIFNPGTENPEFIEKLNAAKIHPEVACTLVMLSIGNY